jgi:hypothetical protein
MEELREKTAYQRTVHRARIPILLDAPKQSTWTKRRYWQLLHEGE